MKTQENVLTDSIYLICLAADLMLQDLEQRLKANNEGLRQRSRQNLNQMIRHMKIASHYGSELMQEVIDADAENKWTNIQTWQDEANEMARLVLLYEDREPFPETCHAIQHFIRSTNGQGVVDDRMLERYYLRKHYSAREPQVGDKIYSGLHGFGKLQFNTIGDNWAVELEDGNQIVLSANQFSLV